jgi:hypothetical protein
MEQLRSGGLVLSDCLSFSGEEGGSISLTGTVQCVGGLQISVIKNLSILDGEGLDAVVQTDVYAYNAWVPGHFNLLRHDNMHAQPGHPDAHHRHEFDWRSGAELPGSPRHVGAAGWPTLADFIQEIADWYWAHRDELARP